MIWILCPIHVVTFTLISLLATDYIQKRRRQAMDRALGLGRNNSFINDTFCALKWLLTQWALDWISFHLVFFCRANIFLLMDKVLLLALDIWNHFFRWQVHYTVNCFFGIVQKSCFVMRVVVVQFNISFSRILGFVLKTNLK